MSEIIRLPGHIFKTGHMFFNGPLNKKLQINGSSRVFNVNAWKVGAHTPFFLSVTVTAEDGHPFQVEYEVGPYDGPFGILPAITGKLDNDKNTSDPIQFEGTVYTNVMPFKLTINTADDASLKLCLITPDLRSYIDRGRAITIIGSDGRVTVPERLLHMRSEALEAILSHDSKENKSGQIEMKDYDAKTLDAFVHFLETCQVKDGRETALGLILLGDKYGIQYMKQMAEKFVRDNIELMDQDEAFETFYKLNQDSLKEAMVDSWSKKRKVRQ